MSTLWIDLNSEASPHLSLCSFLPVCGRDAAAVTSSSNKCEDDPRYWREAESRIVFVCQPECLPETSGRKTELKNDRSLSAQEMLK
ncbi:hypothetical protein E2C01_011395 [Portunus trituberculatus]|uniref:Uncharacterized protein n=1 Tax=Portunus trituberculatus TaxID=210409 RepID=A0A5B7DAZ7_PORTR|nr:hypothetical protein [Portunus trituberculatus]